jgi:hypothetical protein
MTGALFFNYDIGGVEAYGRATATFTEIEDQLPPATSAVSFLVQRNNPFLTPELRNVVAGAFNRTSAGVLGGTDAFQASASRAFLELGLIQYETERSSYQGQFGLRATLRPVWAGTATSSTGGPATLWTSWARASWPASRRRPTPR